MWECRSRSWQTEVLSCNQILKELVEWNFHVKKKHCTNPLIHLETWHRTHSDVCRFRIFSPFVWFHPVPQSQCPTWWRQHRFLRKTSDNLYILFLFRRHNRNPQPHTVETEKKFNPNICLKNTIILSSLVFFVDGKVNIHSPPSKPWCVYW